MGCIKLKMFLLKRMVKLKMFLLEPLAPALAMCQIFSIPIADHVGADVVAGADLEFAAHAWAIVVA